ncbi:MAG: VOC family protein [Chloroflexota bacterium]|nr:VOC family protein [Chloroflexota bacterium]
MIKIKKINHVGISISDRKNSLKFYRDLLGLEVIPSMLDQKNIIWTKTTDGTMVHLVEPNSNEGIVLPDFHVAFEVENFDETLEILRQSDRKIVMGPGERFDGQKFVYILDDDDNLIEFTTNNNIKHTDRIVDELGFSKDKNH